MATSINTLTLLRTLGRHLLTLAVTALALNATAQAETIGSISPPNGTYSQDVVDLKVQTAVGEISWRRVFNGTGWRFNRHWDGISASYKPMANQSTGGGAGDNLSGSSGCWVWVDEDWTANPAAPDSKIDAVRYNPFNQVYPQQGQPLQAFNVNACASLGSAAEISEGYRRLSELYVGANGTYIFKNRYTLKKQATPRLPNSTTAVGGNPQTGVVSLSSATIVQGWRWADRNGSWVEYDDKGQISRYGDNNDNIVWIQRDSSGRIERVIEGSSGKTVFTLLYNADGYLVQVRDYPLTGNPLDLPPRSVGYSYNANGQLASVTDVRGIATSYGYDDRSRLISITDAEGRTTKFSYDGESTSVASMIAADGGQSDYSFSYDDSKKLFYSKLQGPATASGRRVEDYTHDRAGDLIKYEVNGRTDLAITRDPAARTETRVNARGFTAVWTKNEFEQVVQVQNEDGTKTGTQYEARNLNPIETTDEAGIKTRFVYDAMGNLLKKTEAAGTSDERITEYLADSAGRITQTIQRGRTEANGVVTPDAITQVVYDAAGNISQKTDAEGNIHQYQYDRGSNVVKYTDPRGNSTTYQVDANGNLLKVTDALGNARSMAYDKVGNLVSVTDSRSKITQAAYDAMNRRTQTISPVNGSHKLLYSVQGLPIQETDEDGRTSQSEFDNFLRQTKQIDALGNAIQYDYQIADGSSAGQLGAISAPTKVQYPTFTQQTNYDARERPSSETLLNPNALGTEGLVSSTAYDTRGQIKSDTDANGKTRFTSYDALGQLMEITDSLGNKTSAQYDARGNLLQITDVKGNAYKFEYDRNNRITKGTLPLGQTTQYSYDAAGNLAYRIDPNGNKNTYTFDVINRLTQIVQTKAGNSLVRTTTFTWDSTDNLIGWNDTDATRPAGQQTSSATLTYDDANRKLGETVSYPNPAGGTTALSYGAKYSPAGKKTQLTWADGMQIGYGYSGHGELDTVTIPGEGTISINQFKWHAPVKITLPGGGVEEKTYDGLLALESLKIKTSAQQITLNLQNTYGKVGELKQSNRTDSAGNGSSKNSSFSYDDEIRLVKAVTDTGGLFGTDTESFALDGVNNRTIHSKVSGTWQYDANNRLTQRGTGTNAANYEYDDAGNLIRKTEVAGSTTKVSQYGYDTQNRLIEVKGSSGSTNYLIARYGYDPLHRRIWKEQYRDQNGQALAQAKRMLYLYADEGLIAEVVQDITLNVNQSVTATTAPVISTQYAPKPGNSFTTGVLFAKTKNSNNVDVVAYYHHDQINTPVQATDKVGNLVWAASYNVFGQATVTTPTATVDKPTIISNLRLPGQYADEETNLHYNYLRYYDPQTGRYITSDPIGLVGGINTYTYVGGNPLSYTDPSGLCFEDLCIGEAIAAATWCATNPACAMGALGIFGGGIYSQSKQKDRDLSASTGASTSTASVKKEDKDCDCGPMTRAQAMAAAQAWAQVPRASRSTGANSEPGLGPGRTKIPFDELNDSSRGKNYNRLQADGASGLGHRNSLDKNNSVFDHPDGHDDDDAEHHKCPHIHAEHPILGKKIFTYKKGT